MEKTADHTEYSEWEHQPHSEEGGHKHHHAYAKSVINRIARSTGHLNSIKGMVERECDCSEILIQLAAVRSEINGICTTILKEHVDHCLIHAVQDGDTRSVEELNKALQALIRYK